MVIQMAKVQYLMEILEELKENAQQVSEKEVEEMKNLLLEREDKMEHLLKQVARVLANNTNYATLISAPTVHHNKVKFIQLSRVDARQLLAVIVVEGNVIRNNILEVQDELDDDFDDEEEVTASREYVTIPKEAAETVTDAAKNVKNAAVDASKDITDAVADAVENAKDTLEDTAEDIKDGAKDAAQAVADAVSETVDRVKENVNKNK